MNDPSKIPSPLTRDELKDLGLLALFTSVYCRVHHAGPKTPLGAESPLFESLPLHKYPLCDQCRNLLHYAIKRRLGCPLEPKPLCKHCPVHCYRPEYRAMVKEVMRFSGKYLILRGRFDLLWYYFF